MPTALIVEDEPDANALLGMLVRLRGYHVEAAMGGEEALDLLGRTRPDVVFLDLMLPDLNGFEVCRTIKASRETTLIPVVVVSAALTSENEARSYGAGANDFVPKPYTPEQIFNALEAADAWRRDVCRRPTFGTITVDTRDPLEPLRELSRLRSLLRAWTPLDEDDIAGMGVALREVWASATSWGRDRDESLVATIHFRLEPDRVVLDVEDRSGWFPGGQPPDEEGGYGPFDSVLTPPEGGRLELIRRYPVDGANSS